MSVDARGEFTCWTCARGLHMGTDGTNCICCGEPFTGPMLGRFHDEPVPDPWGDGPVVVNPDG